MYEITHLENGIRVVAVPLKERRSVAVGIWVKVGGRDETPVLNGVSHFLEHIVFKGTSSRSANQIKESVEGVGGSLNAFTAEEYTCFLAKCSSRHFEQVFDVLADMVLNPSLKEEDIKKERTVIMEEIKMTQDQPTQLVEEFFSALLWPDHPLGRPLAGTIESVGNLSRKDILGYKEDYYLPEFITIVAAGDVDQEKLIELTRRTFSSDGSKKKKKMDLFGNGAAGPRVKAHSKPTEQTHLVLGTHTFAKNSADEFILDILSVILGGNMSSRLFNEVREERGLAYEIGSFVRKYHETGAFEVSAGVDNHKLSEALTVILKELKKISKEPLSTGELKRAKDFYLGQLDLGLENSMSHMLWVGESVVCLDKARTPAEVSLRVEKITAEDIRRVAASLFKPSSFNLAVVGPKAATYEKELSKIIES